jgi:hypothetical protein
MMVSRFRPHFLVPWDQFRSHTHRETVSTQMPMKGQHSMDSFRNRWWRYRYISNLFPIPFHDLTRHTLAPSFYGGPTQQGGMHYRRITRANCNAHRLAAHWPLQDVTESNDEMAPRKTHPREEENRSQSPPREPSPDVTQSFPELCDLLLAHGLVVYFNALAVDAPWAWQWGTATGSGYDNIQQALLGALEYQLSAIRSVNIPSEKKRRFWF